MNFYSAAQTYLGSLSIELPPNFDDALDALLRDLRVAEREREAKPELIAQGWRNFLNLDNQNREREKLEYISVLGAFTLLTAYSTPELEAAFSSHRQSLTRSKLEMRLRLGSRLFMLGRKGKFGDESAPDIIRLLATAAQTLDEAGRHGSSLKPASLQRMLGIRGVARLLVARSGPQIEADLTRAIADLEQSNRLGDHTVQNLIYRREAALRLYDVTKDGAVLERLGDWLNETGLKDRQFYFDLAQYHQMKASLSLHSVQGPTDFLNAGIAACNAGLDIPAGPALDDLLFFSLRGFLHLLSSQQASFDDTTRMQSLNSAIDDLRKSAKRDLGGASLSQALLRRAGRTKSTSLASAEADLTDALEATRLIHDAQARASIRRRINVS